MKTVLVADDSPVSRELIREVLELEDLAVIEAADGPDALDRIAEARPGLVLMDIQMPRMDGYAVLREMRRDPRLRSIPVVALTAFAMRSDRERALEAGFDGYISKPVDLNLLRSEVSRLLL